MLKNFKAHAWQIAALGLAALLLWENQQRHAAELDAANARTTLTTEREAGKAAALTLSETYRKREQENNRARDKITTQAALDTEAANLSAARAATALRGVRADLADYLTTHRARAQAAAAAGQCAADPGALDLLANLYRRADERAGELAQIADDARRRGSACEAIHDADRRTLSGEGGDAQTR